jgi:glucose/arabinose dehydrogenase
VNRFKRRGLLVATLAFVLLGASSASAQSPQLVQFGGQDFDGPFHIASPPGDISRVFVVEEAGTIQLVKDEETQAVPFLDISLDVLDRDEEDCECGLLSMAFAPDYATSGLFYVYYTSGSAADFSIVIEEFRRSTVNPDLADPLSGRVVLELSKSAVDHNGGQLQFGPDNLLYIAPGDATVGANAQDLSSLFGKLLRIDPRDPPGTDDYSVPSDNPFVGVAGAADEIYSYGLRNPYRFSFDRLTGDLTIGDVGQFDWEEVDFVVNGAARGANFGWRCFEANDVNHSDDECDPLPSNHTPPVLEYANSGAPMTPASVNGGFVVRDTTVPSLLGHYVYADTFGTLGNQIYSAQLFSGGASGNAPTGMTASFVVSFGEDACGHVYVAHGGDTVSRIQTSTATPACQPQTALPGAGASRDTRGPLLDVILRKAKRAAKRGEVALIVSCDESCTVSGAGKIKLPGKDIGLDPDSAVLPAGVRSALELDLSRKEAKRLLAELRGGDKAKALLELTATDNAGNQTAEDYRVKQRP